MVGASRADNTPTSSTVVSSTELHVHEYKDTEINIPQNQNSVYMYMYNVCMNNKIVPAKLFVI